MPVEQTSLCDLVEDNSARYGIAPRRLWKWALDAIATDILKPILPEGYSIDTTFDYGGQVVTIRKLITTASALLERIDPSSWWWLKHLFFDPVGFQIWVEKSLRAHSIVVHPKRPAGRRVTSREIVSSFIAQRYPHGVPAGLTYKSILNDLECEGHRISERTLRRALGRP
jgi:hypothetical protein